jgi:two-component system sensor histidine kinase BarA
MLTSGIRTRVLLLAILPATAASLIFFSIFVNKQIKDIEVSLNEKGDAVARYLATSSEYGIFSGNISLLTPLVDAALNEGNIISITITNNQGTPIIQRPNSTERSLAENKSRTISNSRIFTKPVIQHEISITDFEESELPIPEILGWVVVEVSNDLSDRRKHEDIAESSLITVAILILSIYIGTRISRHITSPITTLTNAAKEIEGGNLDVVINSRASGELLTLEEGIRSMLRSLKVSKQETNRQIEKATTGLRESLKILERQNDELTTARQEALSASQAKSYFLANISHEIRTPMNGILGFIKLIKETNPTKEQLDYLDTIENSTNNLLTIINDVLDLSKIEAGKLSVRDVDFDLHECIENVILLTTPAATEKELEITHFYYTDTPRNLTAPSDRVRQILINLIGNAIKYSDSGTIVVRAMLEAQRGNTVKIKITVSDQGPGISKEDQQFLFNSFIQLVSDHQTQKIGTGLGLSISKSLAEAMNGEIGVDSQPGIGSTFWFTFEGEINKYNVLISNGNSPYHGKTVCLFDTNELTRQSTSHTFRSMGFSVEEYDHFIATGESFTPSDICDLFVLGICSDEYFYDAFNATLKQLQQNKARHILVLIGRSNPELLIRLHEQGSCTCLARPYRERDLISALTELLGGTNKDKTKETSTPVLEVATPEQRRLDGTHILIAEDNPINAKLLETILRQSGARISLAKNGVEAIDLFNQAEYDVIIMDIQMPEMNGIDATRKIRETENQHRRKQTAIIGLTANIMLRDKKQHIEAGFNDILEKPIPADELLHEISYWIHSSRSKANFPVALHHNNLVISKVTPRSPPSCGIDPALSKTLYEMLLAELADTRATLVSALNNQDWENLRAALHRFLGGMSYCNVPALQAAALAFQASLREQSPSMQMDFKNLLEQIDSLLTQARNNA